MTVTPERLRTISFPRPANRKAPAYAADAVDQFLDEAATTLEEVTNDRARLFDENVSVTAHNDELTAALRKAEHAEEKEAEVRESVTLLELANRVAHEHVANAAQIVAEAEALLDQARVEASAESERILGEAQAAADSLLTDAERNVEEVLTAGAARRDELVAEVKARQQELRDLEAAKKAKIAEIKRSVREALDQELGDGDVVREAIQKRIEGE